MPFQEKSDFFHLIDKAKSQHNAQLPFVLFKKAKSASITGYFQKDDELNYLLDYKDDGFIFAPFDLKSAPLLLKVDQRLEVDYVLSNFELESLVLKELGKEKHLKLIQEGIDTIKRGGLKKVVLSRKFEVCTQKSPFKIFQNALNSYPDASCYLWYHPKIGMWIGATPETFLSIESDKVLAMSLAGTLPVVKDQAPVWTKKEIFEQKMVTDYIRIVFEKYLKEVKVHERETVKAGKLWHLRSILEGKIKEDSKLLEIIRKLHPTPAVCGIPVNLAQKFIMENENYDREFYTGFLGELNIGNLRKTHLYVNLRCLKLVDNVATLFVGGGITEGSFPENEWKETQIKSITMLNLL